MNNRLDEIIKMIHEDPDDPFLHYALALEYVKNNQDNKANEIFNTLLSKFPGYLPAYYQSAHFYWELGEMHKAKEIFEIGLELAKAKEDNKTCDELQTAYNNLLIELEDS